MLVPYAEDALSTTDSTKNSNHVNLKNPRLQQKEQGYDNLKTHINLKNRLATAPQVETKEQKIHRKARENDNLINQKDWNKRLAAAAYCQKRGGG